MFRRVCRESAPVLPDLGQDSGVTDGAARGDLRVCWPGELKLRTDGGS